MSLKKYLSENIITGECQCCNLSFVTDINEKETEFINIKKYNLEKRFDYWNKKLFDNRLPKLDFIGFRSLKSKNSSGINSGKVEYQYGSKTKYTRIWDTKILLDNNIKYTQKTLDQILIHEMIHWHFNGVLLINVGHDLQFRQMASKMSNTVGFEIPLVDTITSIEDRLELLPVIGIVLFEFANRTSVMFTSKNKFNDKVSELINNTLNNYGGLGDDTKVSYGLGKYNKVKLYPLLRNFKKLKLYKFEDSPENILWEKETLNSFLMKNH